MKHELQQAFIELKSNDSIDIMENLNKFINLNKGKSNYFVNGNYDVNDESFIFNKENLFILVFKSNRIILNFNLAQSIDQVISDIINILETIFKKDIYKIFNRAGIRVVIGYLFQDNNQVNELIKSLFFNNNILNKFCKNINNASIKFSNTEDNFKFNYNITPCISQQIKVKDDNIYYEDKNHYLALDIDIYKDYELSPNNIIEFCKESKNILQEKCQIFERILSENGLQLT